MNNNSERKYGDYTNHAPEYEKSRQNQARSNTTHQTQASPVTTFPHLHNPNSQSNTPPQTQTNKNSYYVERQAPPHAPELDDTPPPNGDRTFRTVMLIGGIGIPTAMLGCKIACYLDKDEKTLNEKAFANLQECIQSDPGNALQQYELLESDLTLLTPPEKKVIRLLIEESCYKELKDYLSQNKLSMLNRKPSTGVMQKIKHGIKADIHSIKKWFTR